MTDRSVWLYTLDRNGLIDAKHLELAEVATQKDHRADTLDRVGVS